MSARRAAGVKVPHPERVLFPDDGITKGDLVDYYREVAPAMLPWVKDRPANLERFPEGIGRPGFLQQQMSKYFPDWVPGVTVGKEGGEVRHVLLQNARTLVYVADQGTITPHTWLSRRDALDLPDQMIFDVDPPDDRLDEARRATLALGDLLGELGLPAFAKATGSRGYHVVVPLARREGFDSVRAFAREVGQLLETRLPDRVTTEARKAKRGGRIYLDTLRNAYAHTAAPPFAVRARRHAPVATPIGWDELRNPRMRSDRFTMKTVLDRLDGGADPWRGFRRRAVSLAPARERLRDLRDEAEPAEFKAPRKAPR